MQVDQQGREKAQPGEQHRLGKGVQQRRRFGVVDLGVQRQQRSAIEEKQRQAKKKEHSLEIPLPPVAENHHHPKKLQQRSGSKADQPYVDE